MAHHTKSKGDIGLTQVIADLTRKDISVYLPISDYLPIDLIAIKDGKLLRIQSKYISNPNDKNGTIGYRRNKKLKSNIKYDSNDFDYYAIYLADIDKVIYPSIKFGGCAIKTKIPTKASSIKYYWYEDFTDVAIKRFLK